ncbi:MAG: ROK family transcriptional regulator [Propionibacteriaceae bacterium]|jgi:predicted NBD/HSP70 family sugar kinase|nr:ROK family transcriptional regulator [Propionibacteriaceae bacterium]
MRPLPRPNGKALPADSRVHNLTLVLRKLFFEGPLSRADLATATGLTRVTVSDLVAELLSRDLVLELSKRVKGRTGRPATPIVFNPDAYCIIALDLSDTRSIRGALVNLSGQIIQRRLDDIDSLRGENALSRVNALVAELVAAAPQPILGIGVGSPGIVDPNGILLAEAYFGWTGVNLAEVIAKEHRLPCHVANDANAAALAETIFAGARGQSLLTLVLAHGIGAGLVIDGSLVQGSGFAAGEIGHVVADESGAPCGCGRRGCLETFISLPALEKLAGDSPSLADVGWKTGCVLAPIVGALNLDEIVLVAPPELVQGPFLVSLKGAVTVHTLPTLTEKLDLRVSSLGQDATLIGAAALVSAEELNLL